MKLRWVVVFACVLALLPGVAHAQEPNRGIIGSIDRDLTLPAEDTVDGVIVVNGDARIEGTAVDFVLVIRGTATVAGGGVVQGEITVIDGTLVLQDGALVQDVALIDSAFESAPNARVTGDVDRQADFAIGGISGFVTGAFWVAITLVMIAGALAFAAVGASQLNRGVNVISQELGKTLLSTLVVWIALPIVSVLIAFTIIGIPLGVSMIIYVLPSLWFLGYIVMGTRVGAFLLSLAKRPLGEHPYLAAVLGVLVLQLATFVPVLGALSALLAGMVGAGAVLLVAWRAVRGKSGVVPPTAPPGESFGFESQP